MYVLFVLVLIGIGVYRLTRRMGGNTAESGRQAQQLDD